MSAESRRILTAAELDRLKRRDPAELGRLVEQMARPLYRAARGMGFAADQAEDLVQDVFATFLGSLDRFEGRSQVSTWLFGILHRKALERRRALARDAASDPIDGQFEARFGPDGMWIAPPPDIERLIASEELGGAIDGCLEQLPDALREVFVLREVEEMETREIGNILGRTVTHIGVQLHRARTRLRECLESRGWKR